MKPWETHSKWPADKVVLIKWFTMYYKRFLLQVHRIIYTLPHSFCRLSAVISQEGGCGFLHFYIMQYEWLLVLYKKYLAANIRICQFLFIYIAHFLYNMNHILVATASLRINKYKFRNIYQTLPSMNIS